MTCEITIDSMQEQTGESSFLLRHPVKRLQKYKTMPLFALNVFCCSRKIIIFQGNIVLILIHNRCILFFKISILNIIF